MPRLPRVHVADALYYVRQEGVQQRVLFNDRDDYEAYLDLLAEYKGKYQFKLYSYCLLPDRLQLVIEPSESATISEVMRDLTSRYSKYYNSRYNGNGPVFQGRFKASVVEKESYLYPLVTYLYGLPKQLGIVSDVNAYAYSSHPVSFAQHPNKAGALKPLMNNEVKEIMTHFQGGIEDFDRQFDALSYQLQIRGLEAKLSQAVLGSPGFVSKVKREMEQTKSKVEKDIESADIDSGSLPVIVNANFVPTWKVAAGIGAFTAFCIVGSVMLINLQGEKSANVVYEDFQHRIDEHLAKVNERIAEYKAMQGGQAHDVESVYVPSSNKEIVIVLDGTEWDVQLIPMAGQADRTIEMDRILFLNDQIRSSKFEASGFTPTHYNMTKKSDGGVVWETIQRNSNGEIVSWRGEWQGSEMKGILSRQLSNGEKQNFDFVGVMKAGAKVQL